VKLDYIPEMQKWFNKLGRYKLLTTTNKPRIAGIYWTFLDLRGFLRFLTIFIERIKNFLI